MRRFTVPDVMARVAIWFGWLGAVLIAGPVASNGRESDYGKMAIFVAVTAVLGSAQHVVMSAARALFVIAEEAQVTRMEARATRDLLALRTKPRPGA